MLMLVLSALLTLLIYMPALSGPFLFDDAPNLLDNALLTMEKSQLVDWWTAMQSSGAGSLRRPIAMLSFAVQYEIDGEFSAVTLKSGNLLIHLACGLLLFAAARALTGAMGFAPSSLQRRWLPPLAAALWLLNPLLLSTVLYPVQRMAQLSAFFVLAGIAVYATFRWRWSERGASFDEWLALALWLLFFTILATLSKENGVLLPWLVVVLEATLLRGRWAGGYSRRIHMLGSALALLSVIGVALLTFAGWDWIVAGYGYREFTVTERMLTELRVLLRYVAGFLLPYPSGYGLFHDDLVISRSWLQPAATALAAILWVVLIVLGGVLRQRFPWLLMALGFFLVGHVLESGPLALELVFEHRNYLPSIALALLAAALLLRLIELFRERNQLRVGVLAALAILLLFSANLLQRSLAWSSELALASASFARHPDSPRSAHFYANTLLKKRARVGVSAQQSMQLLALARHEFEAVHDRRPDDLSALVMLYTIDSSYFPSVAAPERWWREIEQVVARGKLQATEFSAMRVLVSCVERGDCSPGNARLKVVLDTFSERYARPDSSLTLLLRYTELEADSPSKKAALLESNIARRPEVLGTYYLLIQTLLTLDDYPAVHLAMVDLLRQDRSYRQLALIDQLFSKPSASGAEEP